MQRYSYSVRVENPIPWGAETVEAAQPSNEAAALLRHIIPDDGREHLAVLALDTRGKVIGWEIVSSGTVDACMLYPRDVFAWALQVPLVRYVAVAHNHPSGNVDLSPQDKVGSMVVSRTGALIGLEMVWSMVVTHRSQQWQVWQPERQPQPGNEDAPPQQPEMPEDEEDSPEEAPEEAPEEPQDDSEDSEDVGPRVTPAEAPPEVSMDDVRAAMRRVLGRQ